jgi:cytosine/adenosine deaminase-related metal-dependent hydrolase
MKTLLKDGLILTLDRNNIIYKCADLLINEDTIEQIGENLEQDNRIDKVINCKDKLIMPGLINSHLHSDENLFKGLFDNLPLEPWMLYSCPPLDYGPFDKRLIYLRTMLGAVEMLKNGVTCVQDDVSECPAATFDGYSSVFKAYKDIGMRANVALNINDREFCDKLPFARKIFPAELQRELAGSSKIEDLLSLYNEIINKFNGKDLMKVVVSTSAPQRCTDKYLMLAKELAEKYDLPMHTHILETKMQYVTGGEFYGKSIIKHIKEIGFISDRLTIIHSVWVDDEDIAIMGEAGVSVAHNPVSNLKLGSGIMPLRRLLDNKVNVVLGTDGVSSNDSQNMFEAMKYSALLHKVTNPDYNTWPNSGEALSMAISNAAKSLRRTDEIGVLEPGKKADIIVLDLKSTAFTPINDIKNHLVYCENGSSVEKVFVNGKLVVDDKKLLFINEQDILNEIESIMPEFKSRFEQTKIRSKVLFPYIDKIYRMCAEKMIAINRFSRN